ncbi:DUF917 domain-containing protein [Komagataeibacter europaeus]|uniref:DUF917 domain-containing protein n=1 Tax=Komagataeibacter europaeus TaxID=33995 RepID=UPI000B3E7DDD|nr:DUF917 domain-containing protein [Komagataeibacter europaeus]ARW16553.1 hypothetical protein S101446_01427 [Komagataeibacter europaeus]
MSEWGYVIGEEDLLPLSLGCAVLGTGGGGNPYLGMLRTRELIRAGAQVRIIPFDALDDTATVYALGSIGAPVVGVEKIKRGDECLHALRALERTTGRRADALISEEIGGSNGIEPIAIAAQAGLPVLDGDGMGRAFPEVQMTTFFIYGQACSPAAVADDKGNVVTFDPVDTMYRLEALARAVTVQMGGSAGMCTAPMGMAFIRRAALPGTVTQALRIGRAIVDARATRADVLERLLVVADATLLFTGRVTAVVREMKGGFSVGMVMVAGNGAYAGCTARIAIQNENLVLWVDDAVMACVPDLIMMVEHETGEPITTELVKYGLPVAVIGLPAHDLLRTAQALDVVGPQAFGYAEIDYDTHRL